MVAVIASREVGFATAETMLIVRLSSGQQMNASIDFSNCNKQGLAYICLQPYCTIYIKASQRIKHELSVGNFPRCG